MKETLEKNRLIAEFMNYEGQHEDWCGNNIVDNDDFQGDFMRPFRPESNWSDLMPVVEKINRYTFNDEYNDTAYCRTFGLVADDGDIMVRINRFGINYGKTLIEAIYKAVIEFIEWLNTLSQGEKQSKI